MVDVLFSAGDHVPVIPSSDVVGNGESTLPEQIGAMVAKVGAPPWITVIVKVAVVAH